jgi:endonuclease YncB( thermonuclease family)
MHRPYQIIIPLLSLFLVRVDLTDLIPLKMRVNILHVYDGDTLLIQRGSFKQKLRLVPIDSPELGQLTLGWPVVDAGSYSGECLKKMLSSTGVLEVRGHDIYGRILGDIDGVSLKLIRAGCSTLYPYATFNSRAEKAQFFRALFQAKKQRRGLWARGGFIKPMAWRKKNKKINTQSAHQQ